MLHIHAGPFAVVMVDPPLPLGSFMMSAVTLSAAMTDAGLTWLLGIIEESVT